MGDHMKEHHRAGGMIAVNQQLSAIAGKPATLKQLLVCFKSNALLRRAFRYALQAELSPKVKERPRLRLLAPQAHLQQLQPQIKPAPEPAAPPVQQPAPAPAPAIEQRPPSPRPAAWGNAILNDGGGAEWGDGATPAKAEEPAVKSEQPSEPIKTFGSGSWG